MHRIAGEDFSDKAKTPASPPGFLFSATTD
jgi:hypothetical protein